MSRILQPAEGESLSDLGFAIQSLATVRGYIRACEDILKYYDEMDPDMDDLDQLLASKVQESLDSARRTLEKLT